MISDTISQGSITSGQVPIFTLKRLPAGKDDEKFQEQRRKYLDEQKRLFGNRIMQEPVQNVYKIGLKLGKGAFGIVHIANRKCYKGKKFAIKFIQRDRLRRDYDLLEKELQVLMSLDHPNIIEFDEMYMDNDNFAFVTQFCRGGDL